MTCENKYYIFAASKIRYHESMINQKIEIDIKIYRGMEQLVARWAHNPKAVGSSPAPATTEAIYERKFNF